MASPACNVKDGAGAYNSTSGGNNVTPGNTISIQLASQAGVGSWSISCVYTDDLSVASAVTSSLSIDNLNKVATYTAPASGRAYIFQSRINGGVDINGVLQPSYTSTLGIYTVAASGNRVVAANETVEGNATFGWVTVLNAVARSGGGASPTGAAGGDLSGAYPNPSVAKINGSAVPAGGALTTGNAPYVSGVAALAYSALNLAGGAGWISGVLPVASQTPASGLILALAVDWSTSGVFSKTLSAGANAITFSNSLDGQTISIVLTGAASTVTWPAGTKWPGGTTPTQTASGTDVYSFVKVGTTIYGSAVQAMA